MKEKIKTVYYCGFCKKHGLRKDAMILHEKVCLKKPENERACFECKHLKQEKTTIYFDTYCGERSKEVTLLYCSKKEQFVYPPKVEIKGNAYDLGDFENEPMPKQCKLKEEWEEEL